MAGKNQVTLTFAGDADKLKRTFTDVGGSADRMSRDVTSGFDRVGESADNVDTRAMGFRDTITGFQDLSKGLTGDFDSLGDQMFMIGMGIGDLASGVANFGVQFLQTVATTVAGWVTMGFTATVNAVKMAAAWLISLGPIALVILAIGAVIGILVALGVGFDDVKRWAQAAWDFVLSGFRTAKDWLAKNWPLVLAILTGPFGLAVLAIARHKDSILDFMRGIPGAVTGFFSGLADIITAPFSAAFGAVKSAWNNTVGGFGFTTPSWVPGLGGKSFSIPSMHTGGIVSGAPGSEQLRVLQAGEGVFTARQMRAMGGPNLTIVVQGSLVGERDVVQVVRDEMVRGGFGV